MLRIKWRFWAGQRQVATQPREGAPERTAVDTGNELGGDRCTALPRGDRARMRFARLGARVLAAAIAAAGLGLTGLRMALSHQSERELLASDLAQATDLTSERDRRLAEKGLAAGSPILIRIFKAEFELELWIRKGERFELFATYPICYWSGTLGPKLHEGDKQAPEGFYAVGLNQIHRRGRWPRSFNIGYPNALDRAHARTGSLILVHGGCTSTGCFAMTNPVMAEIYAFAEQALQQGQDRIPIHVFPFRMTEANLAARSVAHPVWRAFWLNLKLGYDLFERTRVPPKVGICNNQYALSAGDPAEGSGPPTDLATPCAESGGAGATPLVTAETEAAAEQASLAAKPRKVASKPRHRSAARHARKTYAPSRRARTVARIETSSVSGPILGHQPGR
jgi:murein L,D-transpeptidase YafK